MQVTPIFKFSLSVIIASIFIYGILLFPFSILMSRALIFKSFALYFNLLSYFIISTLCSVFCSNYLFMSLRRDINSKLYLILFLTIFLFTLQFFAGYYPLKYFSPIRDVSSQLFKHNLGFIQLIGGVSPILGVVYSYINRVVLDN